MSVRISPSVTSLNRAVAALPATPPSARNVILIVWDTVHESRLLNSLPMHSDVVIGE